MDLRIAAKFLFEHLIKKIGKEKHGSGSFPPNIKMKALLERKITLTKINL